MGQFADLKALLEANADKETVRGKRRICAINSSSTELRLHSAGA